MTDEQEAQSPAQPLNIGAAETKKQAVSTSGDPDFAAQGDGIGANKKGDESAATAVLELTEEEKAAEKLVGPMLDQMFGWGDLGVPLPQAPTAEATSEEVAIYEQLLNNANDKNTETRSHYIKQVAAQPEKVTDIEEIFRLSLVSRIQEKGLMKPSDSLDPDPYWALFKDMPLDQLEKLNKDIDGIEGEYGSLDGVLAAIARAEEMTSEQQAALEKSIKTGPLSNMLAALENYITPERKEQLRAMMVLAAEQTGATFGEMVATTSISDFLMFLFVGAQVGYGASGSLMQHEKGISKEMSKSDFANMLKSDKNKVVQAVVRLQSEYLSKLDKNGWELSAEQRELFTQAQQDPKNLPTLFAELLQYLFQSNGHDRDKEPLDELWSQIRVVFGGFLKLGHVLEKDTLTEVLKPMWQESQQAKAGNSINYLRYFDMSVEDTTNNPATTPVATATE